MKKPLRLSLVFSFVLALVLAASVHAPAFATNHDIVVNSLADNTYNDGACTLREAIINANDDANTHPDCRAGNGPDSISFRVNGTIMLRDGLPRILDDLTITGDRADVTLDGRGRFQIMRIHPNVTAALISLTLRGGYVNPGVGGGVSNSGNLTVVDCTFTNNFADGFGGSIFSGSDSRLTIKNSVFTNNSSVFDGGAIYIHGSWDDAGPHTITNSVFTNNASGWSGGGIYLYTGTLIADRNSFSNNEAELNGGGITIELAEGRITNSTFTNNEAVQSGGGIHIIESDSGFGPTVITNSTFSDNQAGENGGGVSNLDTDSILRLKSSTFSGNVAGAHGSGLYNEGVLRMMNTILANSASGFDCYNTGNVTANIHNLIERSPFNLAYWCSYPMLASDPMLGPLTDNGGPTLTHALLPGSPAIDAGHNGRCASNYVWNSDQRGFLRPVDGDGDKVAICDIGAFEK